MRKHHRTVMLLTAAALFFAVIFSALCGCADTNHECVCANADHDCICESCPICIQANIRETLQKVLSFDAAVCASASIFVLGFVCCVLSEDKASAQDTLISLKVKLLN